MVGLDAVTAYTDEIERQLDRLEAAAPAGGRGELRPDRPGLPQAQDLPGRGGRRRQSDPAQAVSRIRADAAGARRQGGGADGLCSIPISRRGRRKIASAKTVTPQKLQSYPGQAAAPVPARPALLAARRRRGRARHARRRSGHRGRADAFGAAFVLVGGWRVARRHRREGCRERLRRQAAAAAASTCRSGASSKDRRKSPTACAARFSTSSPSARRSDRRCRRCSAPIDCRVSFRQRTCSRPTWCACSRGCAKRATCWPRRRISGSS